MTRIMVTVTANEEFLRLEGDNQLFQYSPMDIVRIGNWPTGYLVAPIPNKPEVWGWWQISRTRIRHLRNASVASHSDLIRDIMSENPERVVIDGRHYLFARNKGAARRGVMHVYWPPTDPVRLALNSVGCGDRKRGRIVDLSMAVGLPAGRWSSKSSLYQLVSDGTCQTTRLFVYSSALVPKISALDTISTLGEGTTYAIALYKFRRGMYDYTEIMVAMVPNADRQMVAGAILRLVNEQSRLPGPEERKLT